MTLIKKSQRTLREGCKKCGSTQVYWAHDDERSGKGYVMIDANDVTREIKQGRVVSPTWLHACFKADASTPDTASTPAPVSPGPVAVDVSSWTEPDEPVPAGLSSSNDEMAALRTMLQKLIGTPQIDADEVRAIARSVIDGMVFPTRTVVLKDDEPLTVPGTTHKQLADVIAAVGAGLNVMLVGAAGSGKSTIARQTAEALGLRYFAYSCYPQMSPSVLVGYKDANGIFHETAFTDAWRNGGVVNLDEIDNSHPSTVAVMNEAMSNGHMLINGEMVKKSPDFYLIASGNTWGKGPNRQYVGRQALDAATLDRFAMVEITYDDALETANVKSTGVSDTTADKVLSFVRKVRNNADTQGILAVVSPRASKILASLLAAGLDWDQAVDMAVRKGSPDEQWRKLTA